MFRNLAEGPSRREILRAVGRFCLGGCENWKHECLEGIRGIFPREILKNQVPEVHFPEF